MSLRIQQQMRPLVFCRLLASSSVGGGPKEKKEIVVLQRGRGAEAREWTGIQCQRPLQRTDQYYYECPSKSCNPIAVVTGEYV